MNNKQKILVLLENDFYGGVNYADDFMDSLKKEHPKLFEKVESIIWDYFEDNCKGE